MKNKTILNTNNKMLKQPVKSKLKSTKSLHLFLSQEAEQLIGYGRQSFLQQYDRPLTKN
jgi:hypothetical protein